MKIFLDTANLEQIKYWNQKGIIDGITTNPTHLSKEGGDIKTLVKEICNEMHAGDVSIEITEKEPEKVYTQAKEIAAIAKNVVVKIPCHADYYNVIKMLVEENIQINITLVFSVIQALLMCKLGVKYISPFVGRLDDIEADGIELLNQIGFMVDEYGFVKTEVIAASIRSVKDFHASIMSGVDVATVPIDVLKKSVTHPLTDKGIEKFDADWQTLGIKKFP